MLLEIVQGFEVDYFIDEVVKDFLEMDPNAVLSQFGTGQIDEELCDHHVQISVVWSYAHWQIHENWDLLKSLRYDLMRFIILWSAFKNLLKW